MYVENLCYLTFTKTHMMLEVVVLNYYIYLYRDQIMFNPNIKTK